MFHKSLTLVLCTACCAGMLFAEDWPQFRGPQASGISAVAGPPVEFGPDKNRVWKTEIPNGKSSPVVMRDRIYLTASEGDELIVLALARDSGKVLWRRAVTRSNRQNMHQLNGSAVSTAAADAENVYVFFPELGLLCFSRDGEERWRVPLGPFENEHGMSASPILADGKLILVVDQIKDSFIAAYDPATGKVFWKTTRTSLVGAYSTPAVVQTADGKAEIIVSGPKVVDGYSADTGELLWWVTGMSHAPKATPVVVADTVYVHAGGVGIVGEGPTFEQFAEKFDKDKDGKLMADSELPYPMSRSLAALEQRFGSGDGIVEKHEWPPIAKGLLGERMLAAIRPGGRGDVTDTHVRWRYKKNSAEVPSPLVYQGTVYFLNNGGILRTLNAQSGELVKEGRLGNAIDNYYASPVAADGKVYFVGETGKLAVVQAGGQWEVLATGDLGEDCYATPAIVDGSIYLRTGKALYCFRKSE